MDLKKRVPLEGIELADFMDLKRREAAEKALREQEAKEEAELKASEMEADMELPPDEKDVSLEDTQLALYIRPYSRLPFHLLKRGPKPNVMYRFEKEHRIKDEFGVSVE